MKNEKKKKKKTKNGDELGQILREWDQAFSKEEQEEAERKREESPPSEEKIEETLIHMLKDALDEVVELEKEESPDQIFFIPLSKRPFFPGMAAPIFVEPGPHYEILKTVVNSPHKAVGLFLTKKEDANLYKVHGEDLYTVGVLAHVLRIIPMEQGGVQVVLNMEKRIRLQRIFKIGKQLKAEVTYHEDKAVKISKELKAYAISIITTIKELLKLNPLFKEELQVFLGHSDFTEPGKLADFAVALTTATREELQEVLEAFDIPTRMDKALVLLKKELDLSQLQSSINQKIEATIAKTQRDFFLRAQLNTIKKELGLEKEEKTCALEKFELRAIERDIPEDVLVVIREEMAKLQVLEVHSAEYAVCRNYLDWLTIIPWGLYTEDAVDLQEAEKILAEDHYGLNNIKERILEFIGVGKLTGGVKGSIICLVGPPGVGKTSIGKSIARALNRKFYRFSVGGMRDESEIKGHRRTYIGSMPGKLIQALKLTQVMNPVIMLDEVDKMSHSFHGDPASALLEVLDPEQNCGFLDHYLDVRCDLSRVLFIVTVNILDTIPDALKDRMEILRLSGYVLEEKVQIAKRYLIPRSCLSMGIKEEYIQFTEEALKKLINDYARESGVRNLENSLKKILRKVALKLARAENLAGKKKPPKKTYENLITPENIESYLGKPVFMTDRLYERTPVGVCMGLAWTALGGATLYVEAIKIPSDRTEMRLTGQAGDVMKESSYIAWSYLHAQMERFAPGLPFFEHTQVHLHIPEGATPKDGPSAGITMVTALLSLLKNEPIRDNIGMTGELTLTGKVLPVGGLKEKIIAARRAGVHTVIFPKDNQRDYEELPAYIKEGLEIHLVDYYEEVFDVAFPRH